MHYLRVRNSALPVVTKGLPLCKVAVDLLRATTPRKSNVGLEVSCPVDVAIETAVREPVLPVAFPYHRQPAVRKGLQSQASGRLLVHLHAGRNVPGAVPPNVELKIMMLRSKTIPLMSPSSP